MAILSKEESSEIGERLLSIAADWRCRADQIEAAGNLLMAGTAVVPVTVHAAQDLPHSARTPALKAGRAPRRGKSVEGGATPRADSIVMRTLRYLREARQSGTADCSRDEIWRMNGAASVDAARACLVNLKKLGFVRIGGTRGSWAITDAGVIHFEQAEKQRQTSAALANHGS